MMGKMGDNWIGVETITKTGETDHGGDNMCYFIVLMSSLLFYNVENSNNKEKPLNE